jgi:hypothetical protein
MFGLFRSAPFDDPVLGRLERSGGYWRGRMTLPTVGDTNLAIEGGRSGPSEEHLAAIRNFGPVYERLRPAIAKALAEHRAPYEEALDTVPPLDSSRIWEHATTLGVAVEHWGGLSKTAPAVVVNYRTDWDEEHTLGAVIHDGALVELNGSVLSPF